jgi:pyruvate formate lyase activating enzyme
MAPLEGPGLIGDYESPDEVVDTAIATGAESISYTYTEPTIMMEYALDVMAEAHRRGLKNVFVSNGYMTAEATKKLLPRLAGINVDIKSISDEFYRKVCGGRVAPVLEAVKNLWEGGVWVEATTLVIPQRNDSEAELREIANVIASIDESLPWHVTGFYPTYKLTEVPSTPASLLLEARQWGLEEGLHHVYQGNRPGSGGEDTYCSRCKERVITRRGFAISDNRLDEGGCCPDCGEAMAGIFT